MIKINTAGDYVQLIYVDPVQESVQQELKSDTDAFECSYDSEGKLYLQFGLMRFENPDPTDFTVNDVAVTDAADFISKLNALFTGGGGGGAISNPLTTDTDIDLNGHELAFTNGAWELAISPDEGYLLLANDGVQDLLLIDPVNHTSFIRTNNTPDNSISGVTFGADSAGDGVYFNLSGNAGTGATSVSGDIIAKTITYTAVSGHIFPDIIPWDFANDGAAASGGVPVGGLYHTSGAVKIRLS